ncbi:MAG: hypothetical protein AAB847_00420 [Patescibacteria group bacterium]
MRWLVGGLVLLVCWFFYIVLSHRKDTQKRAFSNHLKGIIRPRSVTSPVITSRIAISLINNNGLLEFRFSFIDGYDAEVICNEEVIDRFVTRGFYKITSDSNEIDSIGEIIEMKTRMMRCAVKDREYA